MRRNRILSLSVVFLALVLMLVSTGCFSSTSAATTPSGTPKTVKPKPVVVSVNADTSRTENSYYAILEITVKNEGAEGTVLINASVRQAGKTTSDKMPVYIQKGKTQSVRMIFPLIWEGGEWTPAVSVKVP